MKLTAHKRELTGKKVKNLRKEGKVPAAVYGPKRESTNITIDAKKFSQLFDKVGFNRFFELEIEGDKSVTVLLKELQTHPVKDFVISANFYEIEEGRKITVEVPITFIGEAPAVKQNVGFLVTAMDSISLHTLPKDLPNEIKVDLSTLSNVGDSISVEVIQLPENVEFDSSVDVTSSIAFIAAPQKEVEEEKPAEAEEGAEGEEKTEGGEESEEKPE